MRPITDKHNISRVKLAYIIDATAAPVCIIAPISSWAAAVSGFAEDGQGLNLFIRAIPYNFLCPAHPGDDDRPCGNEGGLWLHGPV